MEGYEQEADRISQQVMYMPDARLQRDGKSGGSRAGDRARRPSQDHDCFQTMRIGLDSSRDAPVPPIVHEALASAGRPLDPSARAFMEPRFGHDFSRVRVHTDHTAARSAEAVAARAYTVGSHMVFGAGRYAPASQEGRRLIAHELTHVLQQQGTAVPVLARQSASWAEKWGAFWSAGPIDSYRAAELAKEALKATRQTGLPGLHNGPADAWRHCYWNCRMTQVIGKEDAADIAENHEKHGGNSLPERMMDTWNNEEGRKCSGNCDTCCQSKLDGGKLYILYDGDTKVGASKPVPRGPGTPSEKYEKY
jgi:hypothetical protein